MHTTKYKTLKHMKTKNKNIDKDSFTVSPFFLDTN